MSQETDTPSNSKTPQKPFDEAKSLQGSRFLSGIFETIRQPLIILDSELRVASANPAYYHAFQAAPADIQQHRLYELNNGEWDKPKLRRQFEALRAQGEPLNDYPVELVFPTIGRRSLLLNARPILQEGAPTGFFLLAIEDVTDHRREDETLQQNEERYRIISEMVSDYTYAFRINDDDVCMLEWLAGDFSNLTGFTVEESEARGGWEKLIHPDDFPLALERKRKLMAGERDISKFRLIRKDGSIRWIKDFGHPQWDTAKNRVARIIGAATDITEEVYQKLALEAQAMISQVLEEDLDLQTLLERLLHAISHAIPEAHKGSILLADEQGNLHIRALIGYTDPRVYTTSFPPSSGYSALAFHECRPLNISDARVPSPIRYEGEIEEILAIQSAIATPLTVKGKPIGVLTLDNTARTGAFSEKDLQVLTSFSATAALVIERTRLFEETEQRLRELQILQQVSSALSQARTIDAMTHVFIENTVHAVGAAAGWIYLLEENSGDLVAHGWFNTNGEWVNGIDQVFRHSPGEGVTGHVGASGEIYTFADWRSDPITVIKPGEGKLLEPLYSGISLPLRAGEQIIGVMNIWYDRIYNPNEAEKRLLESIADMAGNALQRARLDERTRQRLDELSVLHTASQTLLTTGLDTDAIYVAIHQAISRVMPCEAFVIVLEDPISEDYDAVYLYDRSGRHPGMRIPRGAGLSGQVFEKGETLFITDLLHSQTESIHFGDPQSVRSVLAVPLRQGEHVFGMISAQTYQPNAYHDGHRNLLETLAAQFSTTVASARLFEETQQRLRELELVASLSANLRTAATRADMIQKLLEELIVQMRTEGAAFEVVDPNSGNVIAEHTIGIWRSLVGTIIPAGEGLSAEVLQSGKPYWNNRAHEDKRLFVPSVLSDCTAIAGVPLRTEDQITALLWIGSRRPLTIYDVCLLTSVADMLANALLRIALHEETRHRLEQVQALQTIDRIITTSLDLRFSLDALLAQTISYLGMDAAGVLLYNPRTLTLEYAAGRGFQTSAYEQSRVRLGVGFAGAVALDRRVIHRSNINPAEPNFTRRQLIASEKFVSYCGVPLIAKGQVKGVLESFHYSSFEPDADWLNFFEALAQQAAIAIENAQLFENVQHSNLELSLAYEATIEGWSRALDLRDRETEGHTLRVTELTLQMARRMGMDEQQLVYLRRGALLHDIGKMGIPDNILHKPGSLDEAEWEIMRKHPLYAYEMLYPIQYLRPALDIPYYHHEKWDGSGYPHGLSGEQIPLAARVFAVADVWDALTSDRPYRPAWSNEKALDYIRSQAGSHFDPQVVAVFFEVIEPYLAGESHG